MHRGAYLASRCMHGANTVAPAVFGSTLLKSLRSSSGNRRGALLQGRQSHLTYRERARRQRHNMMNIKTLGTLGLLIALPQAGHAQFLPCNPNSPMGAVGCAGQVLQQMAPPRPAAPPQAAPPVAAPAPATPPVAQPAPQPQQQTATRPPDSGASTASEVDRLTKKYVDDETATYGALKAELTRMGWRQSKVIEPIAPSYTYCGWDYKKGNDTIRILVYCVTDGKDPGLLKAQVARIYLNLPNTPQRAATQPQAADKKPTSGGWQDFMGAWVQIDDENACSKDVDAQTAIFIEQNKITGFEWHCMIRQKTAVSPSAFNLRVHCGRGDDYNTKNPVPESVSITNNLMRFQGNQYKRCPK